MLLLSAIAALTAPPATATVQVRASVRIERPARASAEQWQRLPESRRREVVNRDEHGRPMLLRLIENE